MRRGEADLFASAMGSAGTQPAAGRKRVPPDDTLEKPSRGDGNMDSQIIALMLFLALSAGIVAVGMFARDLAGAFSGGRGGADRPVRLRRLQRLDLESTSGGVAARFDRWFVRMIQETGWEITPTSAALLVGLAALVAGGGALLWTD
ncbi:MAG: hypothetical protein U1E05_15765, partial [Patescibacteria group bacterium]|nr:hypothetical protein [Patescibacteria group bacterium]